MGKIKDKLIADAENRKLNDGDMGFISSELFNHNNSGRNKYVRVRIVSVDADKVNVVRDVDYTTEVKTFNKTDFVYDMDVIGVNPLPEISWHDGMVEHKTSLDWIKQLSEESFTLDDGRILHSFNFNPYIVDNDGVKQYYQRDLCWDINDKQNFIHSLYNEINCGVFILKRNSLEVMYDTLCEYDVIDGKQRLTTIIDFFNDKFPDKNGYYWSDFSRVAQRYFLHKSSIVWYELQECTTDDKIKQAFINVNFSGVPMSKEHIEYVNSINV